MTLEEYLEEYRKQQKQIWGFIIAAYLDKQAAAEVEAFRENLKALIPNFEELRKTDLGHTIQKVSEAYIESQIFTERRHDFYKLKDDDPDTPVIRESLAELKLEERDFETASFAAAGKKICKMADFFRSLEKKSEKEVADAELIKKEGIAKAKEALIKYRNGDPERFAKMLADGLKAGCEVFSQVGEMKEALPWALYTQEVIKILDGDEKLLKSSGLDSYQLKTAKEIAKMGQDIKNGLEAVEIISKLAGNPKAEKPPVSMAVLQEHIIAMHQASYDRTLVDVQKKWKAVEDRLIPDDLEDYLHPEIKTPQRVATQ